MRSNTYTDVRKSVEHECKLIKQGTLFGKENSETCAFELFGIIMPCFQIMEL